MLDLLSKINNRKGIKTMKKKLISRLAIVIIVLAMVIAIETPVTHRVTVEATVRTQAEAVAWVKAQVGQYIDYDGVYGAQCVDLIKAYYNYLGVTPVSGNGCDYATNALPSGWSRVQGGAPQPGDILVYSANSSNPYGHVAIFESTYSTYHQNFNSHPYVENVTYAYNGLTNAYWGYIRPNWSNGNIPQGCVDSITAGTGYIDVRGWAFDKDSTATSLSIHVYIGGGAGTPGAECNVITANTQRTDVNSVYGVGNYHGFTARIYTGKSGSQSVHIYAINVGGGSANPDIGNKTVSITKDTTKPTISNVKISDVDASGYTISCTVSDDCKVSKVLFPSWNNDLYEGNDAVWVQGTISGNTATARINLSTLKGGLTEGHFVTHVYAYDLTGNTGMSGMPSGVPWVTISKTPVETTTVPSGTIENTTTTNGNEINSINNNTDFKQQEVQEKVS